MVETPAEFYRRKKSTITVRHVSGDRIVAMLEIVSPGDKSSLYAFRALVDKACELLQQKIHLLLIANLHSRLGIRPGTLATSDRVSGIATESMKSCWFERRTT